jgi:glucose dehydrogenase
MKLLKHDKNGFQYELNRREGECLRSLLNQFPVTENNHAKISRTCAESETVEREKLLNESLAQHRDELKELAKNLMSADKLKKDQNGWRLSQPDVNNSGCKQSRLYQFEWCLV